MSDGQPKFSWNVEKIESNEGRFKCTCISHPHIFAFGDSETQAIRLANTAMETAVDKAEL